MTTTIIKRQEDTLRVQAQLLALIPQLDGKNAFECIIQKQRVKRSKNANDYSWVLQDKIAKKLNRRIDDIHNEMVLQYGVVETYSILKQAFESAKRMFDYYEVRGESKVGEKEFVHVKAGIGTHLYDSKEMAKFIDGVVAEAQDYDIETKTPQEIAELKSLWESGKR